MKTSHIIALTICLTVATIQANGESSLTDAARKIIGFQTCITSLLVSTPALFAHENKSSYLQAGVGFMVIAAGVSAPNSDLIMHGAELIFNGVTEKND